MTCALLQRVFQIAQEVVLKFVPVMKGKRLKCYPLMSEPHFFFQGKVVFRFINLYIDKQKEHTFSRTTHSGNLGTLLMDFIDTPPLELPALLTEPLSKS